ncbi:MAG: hypothetical protein KVP17_002033 [Porospora cf. gigantea B]|nr:MAG: hypothetical protein KVP17_002033 [Porospora cf. gigantea B]
MATLIEVIAHCHKVGVPVILDAKRGDIGSTAEAYAAAAYDVYGADAVTVSPFMGSDSIRPFLRQGKGVFVLCKTSNPGSNEVMCLDTVHGPVYRCVGAMVEGLRSLHPDMGLVVGATDPQTVGEVHRAHPDVLILAPGVGAQGGSLAACMASCPDNLLLPMSRALTTSPEAARKAVELMREQWA